MMRDTFPIDTIYNAATKKQGRPRHGLSAIVCNLIQASNYDDLRAKYPWVQEFRAGFIIYTPESAVLLVQQSEAPVGCAEGKWSLPKGRERADETSGYSTAVRELHEETGIQIRSRHIELKPKCLIFTYPGFGLNEVHIFFVAVVRTRPQVEIRSPEICGYTWYPYMQYGPYDGPLSLNYPTKMILFFIIPRCV